MMMMGKETAMKRTFLILALALTLVCIGAAVYGFIWVRQYQVLQDDEPEVVLVPDIG